MGQRLGHIQLGLADTILLVGVTLALAPGLESAARLPKLSMFLVGAGLLIAVPWSTRLKKHPLALWLGALYLWRAVAPGLASWELWDLRVERVLLGVVGLCWLVRPPSVPVQRALIGVALLEVALGLLQFAGRDPLGLAAYTNQRALGTLGNTSAYCMFLSPLGLLCFQRGHPNLALVLLAGSLLSGSRAGLLAVVISLLYLLLASPRGRRGAAVTGLVLVTIAAGAVTLSSHPSVRRSSQGPQVRLALWAAAARITAQNPLGLGPGRFGLAYLPHRALEPTLTRGTPRVPEHCHSEWLGLGVEGGLPALFLVLAVITKAWAAAANDPYRRAALLSLLIQGAFFRFTLPVELLWLWLLGQNKADPPDSDSGHRFWPGLLLALAITFVVSGWLVAERAAWLAKEAEIRGSIEQARQLRAHSLQQPAPSRRSSLQRPYFILQLQGTPRASLFPELEEALAKTPHDPYLWAIAAEASLPQDEKKALEYYQKAAQLDPHNSEFAQAVQRLKR